MDPRMHSDAAQPSNPAQRDPDHTAAEAGAGMPPRRVSRFDYVQYDEHATRAQREFKEAFINLEQLVLSRTGLCRAQVLIFTKLEEAYMWVGKAIRDDQVQRDQMKGTLPPLQEGRGNQ